jgi:hypothetical protein
MSLLSRRALALLFASAAVGSLPGTAAELTPNRRPTSREVWARTELYFGTQKPDGSMVTEQDFVGFVDAQVTPKFPDGLTLLSGYGQFRNSAGTIVKERSMVLILFYPPQTEGANARIEEIRRAYKYEFQQESVLRVDSLTFLSF